ATPHPISSGPRTRSSKTAASSSSPTVRGRRGSAPGWVVVLTLHPLIAPVARYGSAGTVMGGARDGRPAMVAQAINPPPRGRGRTALGSPAGEPRGPLLHERGHSLPLIL